MRFLLKPLAGFVVLFALALSLPNGLPIWASSQQAYQDYLYQFDVYRRDLSDFQTARGEYLKFQTLTSQTTALEKTKAMLSQRLTLLRTYLLLLTERLNEDHGLTTEEQNRYRSLVSAEVNFSDRQKAAVPAISSLEQATSHSKELEARYPALYATMRGIGSELLAGAVVAQVSDFDRLFEETKTLIEQYRPQAGAEKQATIDRWVVVINNKRGLLEQTLEKVRATNQKIFQAPYTAEADRWAGEASKTLVSAKQQLTELASNLGELVTALRYQD